MFNPLQVKKMVTSRVYMQIILKSVIKGICCEGIQTIYKLLNQLFALVSFCFKNILHF
jgi:hypothetical protein